MQYQGLLLTQATPLVIFLAVQGFAFILFDGVPFTKAKCSIVCLYITWPMMFVNKPTCACVSQHQLKNVH